MTASRSAGSDWHRVTLKPNAMERVKERLSRSDIWALKEERKAKEPGVWRVKARFCNRTCSFFDRDPPKRYNSGKFDAVMIVYSPGSPRKTFELVWTKVCPGLLLP
jgi:hypothetical protein